MDSTDSNAPNQALRGGYPLYADGPPESQKRLKWISGAVCL